MGQHDIHARAKDVPLTEEEIQEAGVLLEKGPVCVATIQRRLRIGWNRAADLIAHIKGPEALPEVARHLL
jgi:DNA segregation ATPase FtsK/SpoIIIE-like protein